MIHHKLKEHRERLSLTHANLSVKTGYAISTIMNVESHDRNPSIKYLGKMYTAFNRPKWLKLEIQERLAKEFGLDHQEFCD